MLQPVLRPEPGLLAVKVNSLSPNRTIKFPFCVSSAFDGPDEFFILKQYQGKPFEELNLKEKFPNLKIINGGSWMEKKKMKPKVDPMTMLRQYMEQQGLRLGPEFYF